MYWSDCDAAGILYYGNFFRFFEIAEEELFASLGRSRVDIYQQLNVGFPRVEASARYRQPARMGDLIEVTTWISRRSEKSLQFHFEMRRDGELELVAEGSYRVVCISRPQFRPIAIPPEVIELLREYLPPLTPGAKEQPASQSEPPIRSNSGP